MAYSFLKLANNAYTTLSTSVASGATSLTVTSSTLFPSSGNFICTIWNKLLYPDPSYDPGMEIIKVTAVSGNTFTILKAQEGTSDNEHNIGDNLELLLTTGVLQEIEAQVNAPRTLAELTDVSVNSPTSLQVLLWNGTKWVNAAVPIGTLANLTDTDIVSPTSGQTLEWNGTSWTNVNAPTSTPSQIDTAVSEAASLTVRSEDLDSAGVISGGLLTLGTTGTYCISAGVGYAYNGTNFIRVTWSTRTNVAYTYTGYNYIAFDSTGTLNVSATQQSLPNYIRIGNFFVDPTELTINAIWQEPELIGAYANKNNQFIDDVFGSIVSSGFVVTEQSNPNYLKLNITAGDLYDRLLVHSYSSSTSFLKLMRSSDLYLSADIAHNDNTINTTLWNDGTQVAASALVTMTTGYWAKALIVITTAGQPFYIYPQAQYATKQLAQSAPIPLLDIMLADGNVLLATIVFQNGATSIASGIGDVRPLWSRVFTQQNITLLEQLNDTNIAGPDAGQLLGWNGTAWVNVEPQTVSAGSGVIFYPTQTASDISPYFYFEKTLADTVYVDLSVTCNNNKVPLVGYISDPSINVSTLNAGVWTAYFWGYASIGGSSQLVIDYYDYEVDNSATILLFEQVSNNLGLDVQQYVLTSIQPAFTLASGHRLLILVSGQTTNITDTLVHGVGGDATHPDYISTPLITYHNDLSGLQGGSAGQYYHLTSAQFTVVGNTSGTNTGDQTLVGLGGIPLVPTPVVGDIPVVSAGGVITDSGVPLNILLPTVTTVTSNYNALYTDSTILCNAISGPIIITLPDATISTGNVYVIKKIDSSRNTVTIDALGNQFIDGQLTQTIGYQNTAVNITSDGTQWWMS